MDVHEKKKKHCGAKQNYFTHQLGPSPANLQLRIQPTNLPTEKTHSKPCKMPQIPISMFSKHKILSVWLRQLEIPSFNASSKWLRDWRRWEDTEMDNTCANTCLQAVCTGDESGLESKNPPQNGGVDFTPHFLVYASNLFFPFHFSIL